MGDVVNLRAARKAKALAETARTAQARRAKFGRTKAEKARDQAEAHRLANAIEGARREE